jgi:hypothetical protein
MPFAEGRLTRLLWNSTPSGTNLPEDLFGDVSDWPLINDLFEVQSQELFSDLGIPSWLGMGGEVGADGRLGFGPHSGAALRILNQVLAKFSGFRWDDGAVAWAVCPFRGAGTSFGRLAYAVSFQGSAHLLDARTRADWANVLDQQLTEGSRPGRIWNADDRALDVKLRRCSQQIQQADSAERCLLYLHSAARCGDDGNMLIPAENLAAFLWPGPEHDRPNAWMTEVVASLHALLGYQLALVRLGDFGWEPSILSRSSAVSSVEQQSPDIFQVCVSPWLAKALDAFARGTGAENPGVLA